MFRQADKSLRRTSATPRGLRVFVCGVAISASVLSSVTPSEAAPKPPPNPSDSQISAAQAKKNALAAEIGRLSAELAAAQTKLRQLTAQAELAEQRWALAVQQLNDAKAAAVQAQKDIVAAQHAVDAAHATLTKFVGDSYVAPTDSGAGGFLTANDPNSLLQRNSYQQYVASSHLTVMSAIDKATVAKSNADARAKAAVQLQTKLTLQADAAKQAAFVAVQQEKSQQTLLQAQQASNQQLLSAAQLQLATLNNQRATYVAYVKEQQRLAAIAAEKARQARIAAAAAAAAAAARLAAEQAANNNNNNSGGGGSYVAPVYNPAPGSMGGWTAAKGQGAVDRAMTTLGTPYAWAGGNANGPTYGVNSPGTDGWNDSTVYGYDCSGLVMYAWASQGLYLPHYAATQYTQAGSYHPGSGDFMPGDLLFWSADGTIGGIHHVAIYIGGGNVIQAPYSGTVVQVTPWNQVSNDYFGATRPLS